MQIEMRRYLEQPNRPERELLPRFEGLSNAVKKFRCSYKDLIYREASAGNWDQLRTIYDTEVETANRKGSVAYRG